MRCEQVITGAVNNGSCVVATGQIGEQSFIAYASGSTVVILTPELGFVQKIEGESLGYGSQPALCVTSSEDCGRIGAAWGDNVCVFEPECLSSEERLEFPKAFLYKWCRIADLKASSKVHCLSFDKPGDRLLTGGQNLQLWMATTPNLTINGGLVTQSQAPSPNVFEDGKNPELPEWACTWQKLLASAAEFILFSPDGQLFATTGQCDRAVKIWYEVKNSLFGIREAPLDFTFTYVTHPRQVSSFSWRQTSAIIPRGVVANVLLTRCHDNVCRVWAQTRCHQDHYDQSQPPHHAATNSLPPEGTTSGIPPPLSGSSHASSPYKVGSSLHFHLAGSIDQGSNIPMHSSSTSSSQQRSSLFTVHWMDNKKLCLQFAAKAMLQCEKAAACHSPMGRASPASMNSEDSLVIVNGSGARSPELGARGGAQGSECSSPSPLPSHAGDFLTVDHGRSPSTNRRGINGDVDVSQYGRRRGETVMASGNWVVVPVNSNPGQWVVVPSPSLGDDAAIDSYGLSPKAVRALLHEWQNTPDMLFAIHPLDGSLLVWMIDGLDAPSQSFRLPRLSFASRIPHAMPTADIWTLQGTIFTIAGACTEDGDDISKLLSTPAKKSGPSSSRTASGRSTPSAWMRRRCSGGSGLMQRGVMGIGGSANAMLPSAVSSQDVVHPTLVLVSHHIGGALHLWSMEFARGSGFMTPFAMRRAGSALGHRLPCQSALVHPSAAMLMSAAHLRQRWGASGSGADEGGSVSSSRASELILWHMHASGALELDGDVLQQVSVLHSNQHGAFRQQCWIDSKLALSTTELAQPVTPGGEPVVLRVGPSTLFVTQDEHGMLAIFQVITDAVQWLGVHGGAANSADKGGFGERKHTRDASTVDSSSSVSSPHWPRQASPSPGMQLQLGRGDIVSRQCGAQPGCVLHLGAISDLESLPGDVVLLHSFPLTDAWLRVINNDNTNNNDNGGSAGAPTGDTLEADETVDAYDYGNDDDSPLVPREVENFLVVAVESRTPLLSPSTPTRSGGGGDSEQVTSDTMSMLKANTSAVLHTWLVSVCREAVSLPADAKLEDPVLPPVVGICSRRLTAQRLPLPLGVNVASATVASGHADAASQEGLQSPPAWQIATVCSDQAVRLWRCTGRSADLLQGAVAADDEHLDGHGVGDGIGDEAILPMLHVEWELVSEPSCEDASGSSGGVLAVSATSASQLAVVHERSESGRCTVEMWDSSASGGHCWQKETLGVSLSCSPGSSSNSSTVPSGPSALPLWMPHHNGSSLLAVTNGNRMSLMLSHRRSATDGRHRWQRVASTQVAHLHDTAVTTTTTRGESPTQQSTDEPRATNNCCHASTCGTTTAGTMLPLAWCRGNVLVGYNGGSILLVLSHWLSSARDTYKASRTTCMSVRTCKGGSDDDDDDDNGVQESLAAKHGASSNAYGLDFEGLSVKSVLQLAADNTPHLPQYHPDQLSQLLHAGRLQRVRSILAHLIRCLARRALVLRHLESRRQANDEQQAKALWWRTPGNADGGVVGDLYPMPLSQLLCAEQQRNDGPTLSAVQTNTGASSAEREAVEDTDYDELFGNNRGDLNMELELHLNFDTATNAEEDDSAEEIRVERSHLTASTFGAAQFDFLTSFLSKARLLGLTSAEQMRLLALADTVASTHHQFSSEGAQDGSDSAEEPAAVSRQVLGGGGASGAGYASRTEGGEEGIDDCGLRFLLSMRQYNCLLHSVAQRQRAPLAEQGLSTSVFAWAFHSHAEEELLSLVPCVQSGRLAWPELRAVGVGWWLRSQESLRRLAEKIAKARFSVNQDPLDAALFYLAMKKQSLLRAMFRNARDDRMATFFANDFKEERWRKAALKNAFVLLGKQRLEQAAAFFLLGSSLDDCIEVCLHRMHDLQLALVVCRLYEGLGEAGPCYQKILRKNVLDATALTVKARPTSSAGPSTPRHSMPSTSTSFVSNSSFGLSVGIQVDTPGSELNVPPCQDPFLRSLSHWILQDYGMALDTVLENVGADSAASSSLSSPDADVTLFNFYFFLREHPLLLRRQYSTQANTGSSAGGGFSSGRFNLMGNAVTTAAAAPATPVKPRISGVGSEPLTVHERKLLFQTAHAHMLQGRLLMVLDVLSHLSAFEVDSESSPASPDEAASPDGSSAGDTAAGFDWSQPASTSLQTDTADSFDWSTPVTKAADTAESFDWGAPVDLRLTSLDEMDSDSALSKPVGQSLDDDDISTPVTSDQKELASVASPENEKQSTPPAAAAAAVTTYSVTQWSAAALRWRAVLNLMLAELSAAVSHVMESGLVDEFLADFDEKVLTATDDQATPTASLNQSMRSSAPEPGTLASSWKPRQCARSMELRRFVWAMLVEELSAWEEMSGSSSSSMLTSFQKDALVRALHGTVARCNGDQISEVGTRWIREHRDVLASMWRYLDLHAPRNPPLQAALLEIGILLQRPQPPALSVVHSVAVAMFRTELAVSDHAQSPRRILREVAELLPQAMPPFLLSASPLPCHTLWSPLSYVRGVAQQIFSAVLECPDLPGCGRAFGEKRIAQLTQLCSILSNTVVQTLSTVDHALTSKSHLHLPSGRCSPFAFSLVQNAVPGHMQAKSDSPPELLITRDAATPPTGSSSGASSATAGLATSAHHDSIASRNELALPSQWPGLRGWPRHLSSTDWCMTRCADMASLSLLLGEAAVAVYIGMLAVALARLSPRQLLTLMRNMPNEKLWYAAFGGGYRLSTAGAATSSAMDANAMDSHERAHSGNLRKRVTDTMNATARRLHHHHHHMPGGRDSTTSLRSSDGSRRARSADVYMFPAVTLDEFFMRFVNEPSARKEAVVTDTEAHKPAARTWNYCMDDISDELDDDEESLPSWDDPKSAGWCLMQSAVINLVADGLKSFLPLIGVELAELPLWSPWVYNTFCQLDVWQMQAQELLEQSPEDLRDTLFKEDQFSASESLDVGGSTPGPALLQHKALLEPTCTPFSASTVPRAVACEQLWHYLVKQEAVRDIFISNIFTEEMPAPSGGTARKRDLSCLVYKEPDVITSIAINQANPVQMVVATSREVVEIDTSFLLDSSRQFWTDDDEDTAVHRSAKRSSEHGSDDFLMVHSVPGLNDWSSRNSSPDVTQAQSGTGAVLLMRRQVSGVRHVECHPTVPYYLCGGEDGSVRLWEFGRNRAISSHRASRSSPAVTKMHFTRQGNKFAASDVSGNVALWQFGSTLASSDPYAEVRCHNRCTNDFVFMSSSSFLATAGHSTDGKNVALYDFLVPPQKALIRGFTCHEGGATSVVYAPSHQLIFSAGKKGDICVFDVRQRALLNCLPAHHDGIRSLSIAENEEFFASGGADGTVKLWDVSIPRQRNAFTDEHVKTSFFRSSGSGVQQIVLSGHSSQMFSCGADGLVKWRLLSS